MTTLGWNRRFSWVLLIGLALSPVCPPGRASEGPENSEPETDPWAPLELLVGSWEGAISGKLGVGRGFRRYDFVMNERFLVSRHRSIRLPQEKSPEGDQHEELGVFSFDSERQQIVYREFMAEGVVIRSPCDVQRTTIVCTSEAVESGPGIRARLTLEIADRYRFTEVYELALPGRELEHYFANQWTRTELPFHWD